MPAKGMVIRPLADSMRSAQKLGDLLREAEAAGLERRIEKDPGLDLVFIAWNIEGRTSRIHGLRFSIIPRGGYLHT
jgi:hypothetical protein